MYEKTMNYKLVLKVVAGNIKREFDNDKVYMVQFMNKIHILYT